ECAAASDRGGIRRGTGFTRAKPAARVGARLPSVCRARAGPRPDAGAAAGERNWLGCALPRADAPAAGLRRTRDAGSGALRGDRARGGGIPVTAAVSGI